MKRYFMLPMLLGILIPTKAQYLGYTVMKELIGQQVATEVADEPNNYFSNLNFDCMLLNNNQVKIFWVTPPAYQSKYFLVERSIDGKTYEELTKTIAKKNTEKDVVYFLIDPTKLTQTTYYRIVEFKDDGEKKTSEILMITESSVSKMAYSKQEGKNVIQLSGKYDFKNTDVMLVSVATSMPVVCELTSNKEGELTLTSAYDLPAGEYMIKLREIRNTKRYKFTINDEERVLK